MCGEPFSLEVRWRWRGADVLMNAAGVNRWIPSLVVTPEAWDETWTPN